MRYVSNFTVFLIPPNIYLKAIVALEPLKLQTKFTQTDLPASLSYTDLLCRELKAILAATLGEFEVIPKGPIYYLVHASPFPYSVH